MIKIERKMGHCSACGAGSMAYGHAEPVPVTEVRYSANSYQWQTVDLCDECAAYLSVGIAVFSGPIEGTPLEPGGVWKEWERAKSAQHERRVDA